MNLAAVGDLVRTAEEKFVYALLRSRIQRRITNDKSSFLLYEILHPRFRELVRTREEIWVRCFEEDKLWLVAESDALPASDTERYGLEFHRNPDGYDCSPRRVCELSDVRLLSDRAIVQMSDGKYVYESMKGDRDYLLPGLLGWFLKSKLPFGESTHFDTAVSLVMHTWSPAQYGHWLVEYLPKLLALSVYEERTGRTPDIIIPRDPPEWMTRSLSLLGYPDERLVEWTYETATVDRLVQPFTSTTLGSVATNEFSPIEHRWLRNQLLDAVDGESEGRDGRYYVSRQGMHTRYVENFEQIEPVLEAHGFRVVRPEELGFREQIELFSGAAVLVGSHASGLHNQLFTRDATVVEFFPPGIHEPSNQLLAGELGHDYVSLSGDRSATGSSGENGIEATYRIDPETLGTTLARVVSRDEG
jgi:hypothetical protein